MMTTAVARTAQVNKAMERQKSQPYLGLEGLDWPVRRASSSSMWRSDEASEMGRSLRERRGSWAGAMKGELSEEGFYGSDVLKHHIGMKVVGRISATNTY